MASLDGQSQIKLHKIQDELTKRGIVGTQTSGIPFHISLGSFPLSEKWRLNEAIKRVADGFVQFEVSLCGLGDFDGKVLFLQPQDNGTINVLHGLFDCNYSDGLPFRPHITLFCGERSQTAEAKRILGELSLPSAVTVTSLLLGEFFPAKLISEYPLLKR